MQSITDIIRTAAPRYIKKLRRRAHILLAVAMALILTTVWLVAPYNIPLALWLLVTALLSASGSMIAIAFESWTEADEHAKLLALTDELGSLD